MSNYREEVGALAMQRADAWIAYQRAKLAEREAVMRIQLAHLDDFPDEPEQIRRMKAEAFALDDARCLELREATIVAAHEVERLTHLSPWGD